MNTTIFRMAGVFFLLMIIISCSDKNNDIEQKDIISWIKPCLLKNDFPSIYSLSVKADQGFLVSGYLFQDNEYHGIMINMNPDGDTIWTKRINLEGYTQSIIFYALEKSPDEILVTGITASLIGHRFIMWLDGQGNMTKQVILPLLPEYSTWDGKLFFGSTGEIRLVSFLNKISDNTMAANTLRQDLLTPEGQEIDSTVYQNIFSASSRVMQKNDGDLLIAGATWPGGSLDNLEMLFMQTHFTGEIIARKEFGSDSWDVGESVCQDFSEGYFVSGSQTYACEPVIYPVSSSGDVGKFTSVADTIHSYGTILKKSNDGYLMFIQGYSRLYFIKLDKEMKTKYISFIDYQNNPVGFPSVYFHVNLMIDGSFTFLYISDFNSGFNGISLIKTKPV
jgi:hypothetical protein